MPNSMDCIQVAYGQERLTRKELGTKRWELAKQMVDYPANVLDFLKLPKEKQKELKVKVKNLMPSLLPKKTLPLSDFLRLNPETLTEDEQKIQRCLNALYQANNDPKDPLFSEFPKRENPLTIDCTILPNQVSTEGEYLAFDNVVILKKQLNNNEKQLLKTLAHELKHAQQVYDRINFNNYQLHQLRFLAEAQARACGDRAIEKCFHCRIGNRLLGFLFYVDDNFSTECACVREQLEYFPFCKEAFNFYKDRYDAEMPIHLKEKGLEKIPESFGFSANDEKAILKSLEGIPKIARTLDNLLLQALVNQKKDSFVKILNLRDKTGNPIPSREGLSRVIDHLLEFVDEGKFDDKNAEFLRALIGTQWVSWDDLSFVPGRPHIFSAEDSLTPKQKESRLKYLKTALTTKTKTGKMIIPLEEIKCAFICSEKELTEKDPEFTKAIEKLIDSARKPQLKKTLARLQRKSSAQSKVSRKKQKEI